MGFLLLLLAPQQASASLVIGSTPGKSHEILGFTTFTTSDMIGMKVDVYFDDGSTDSQSWASTGVSTSQWQMTFSGATTFSSPFTLENFSGKTMTRFVMHGGDSTTVFDRSVNPSTPGSANGRDLQEYTSLSQTQDINVTYFDWVFVSGQMPVGDLYAGMDVSFETGIASGDQFIFRTDTDTTFGSVFLSNPEPSTALPFVMCVLLAVSSRLRRNPGSL